MQKLTHNITHPGECIQDPRPGQLCGQEHLPHHEEEHPSLSQQHGPKHHRLLDKPQEHGQPPHHAQQNVAAHTPSPDQYTLSENKPHLVIPKTAPPEHGQHTLPIMQAEQEQIKITPKQIPAAHPPSTKSRPANQSSDESVTAKGGRQPAPPPCTYPKARPANQSPAQTLPAEGGRDPALPRSPPARPTTASKTRRNN